MDTMCTGKMDFTSYPNGSIKAVKNGAGQRGGGNDPNGGSGFDKDGNVILESGLSVLSLLITRKCWGIIGLDLDDGPDGNA